MKPIPGKPYTIQDENTLTQVASRAYGDGTLWPRIWDANQTTLRSGDPDLIFPGEIVLIPILPERALQSSSQNNDRNGIFVDLDGYEIRPLSARIIRTIDTIANAATCDFPWVPGADIELDKRVQPKSYTPLKVSIGGERIVTGRLYMPESTVANGTTLKLHMATSTADLVDSDIKPQYESRNISLEDIIKKQVEPLGFTVINLSTDKELFDTVTARQGESIFGFASGLARQRGVLLSCDTKSNVTITNASTNSSPVATLEEGVTPGVTGWGSKINGRLLFNTYRAVGRSPIGNKEAISQDNGVPISRRKTIRADESTKGNIQAAVDWARNKANADALGFKLEVADWRDPQGDLWKENTIVAIISPSMFIPDGFNFLISSVEYVLGNGGRSSVLSFVPPTVYTQGEVVLPW